MWNKKSQLEGDGKKRTLLIPQRENWHNYSSKKAAGRSRIIFKYVRKIRFWSSTALHLVDSVQSSMQDADSWPGISCGGQQMFCFVPDGRMLVITEHSLWSRLEPGTSSALWGSKCLSGACCLWTPSVLLFLSGMFKHLSGEWMDVPQPFSAALSKPGGGKRQAALWRSSLLLLQLLYEDSQMVTLTAPYIAGFLAFRETPFLLEALQRLRRNRPELLPQVCLMMRNSILNISCQCATVRVIF